MKGAFAGRACPHGLLVLLLVLVGATWLPLAGCAGRSREEEPPRATREVVSDGWLAMGTFFEIDLRLARRDLEAGRRYVAWVREEIDRLERIYSRHDPGSAISELNRAFAASDGSGSGVRVVPELEALLALSLGVGEESGGAFDVTVGPLVDVWNRAVEAGRWPSVEVLRAAKRRVGGEHVELAGDGRVAATVRDVRIDLDALSKLLASGGRGEAES